jgi:hypothetical protein
MYPSVGSKRERRNDARWDDVWMTDTELETFVREVMHEVNSTAYATQCVDVLGLVSE